MIFRGLFILVLFFSLLPNCVVAEPAVDKEAKAFFDNYVKLGENFDVSISDLYSDQAKIKANRIFPDGKNKEIEFEGAKWKSIVKAALSKAKKKGDVMKFSNIKVTVEGSKATIKADRYSALKCYSDKAYYMVIEKNSGKYQIVEEYVETHPQSKC